MSKKEVIKKAICFFCPSSCGVLVKIDDGRVVRVDGDPGSPGSQGFICERSKAAPEHLYHKDRLNYPQKRVGERGEGKWKRISWEQGMEEVAEKLEEIKNKNGPEAIALSNGTYRTVKYVGRRFMNLLGSPNILAAGTQVCFCNVAVIESITYGRMQYISDYDNAQCIVEWAANPAHAWPQNWVRIIRAKRRGAKLIAVDPRFTETAARADIWLQPRPGTDTALLMGWMNVIINENLYDRDFVGKWTVGFKELKERVQKYSPEKVAEITEVPSDKIRESARIYATTKPACFGWGVTFDQLGRNSTQAVRARAILRAITGNLDIKGGNLVTGPHPTLIPEAEIEENERLSPEQRKKQLGADRFKLYTWDIYDRVTRYAKKIGYRGTYASAYVVKCNAPATWRAILTGKPYPVRAMMTVASNPMITNANIKMVYEAIKKLDLYVVSDYWMTPSAGLADYVFPAAGWIERPWLETHWGVFPNVEAGERAIEPLEERRTDFQFYRELGIRLGQVWPWKTMEELYDYQLKPMGYTWEEFVSKVRYDDPLAGYKRYERSGFATPSGKVEIYSSILEELGYDPLPEYMEPAESIVSTPELAKEYPFTLITGGRFRPMFHSEHRQIESLRRMHPDPIVQINPEVGLEYGIADGDWMWIETRLGRTKAKAKLYPGIDLKVVHAEHGWWFPEMPGEEPCLHGAWESNVNILTDDDLEKCDPMVGGWQLRHLLCRVYKA
jgi:thiosulfate reductase / polysulfide reductase chain A